MEEREEELEYVLRHTYVVRPPKQHLSTFGTTTIHYYLLTEPSYTDLVRQGPETVVREGKLVSERPRIVTPNYLLNLFDGFPHGEEYARYVLSRYGPHEPGLLYRYRQELKEMTIVSNPSIEVTEKLIRKIEENEDSLAAIIKGVDQMWDVSLMKFIHELTQRSLERNVFELSHAGSLETDQAGVPRDAREGIEALFDKARYGKVEPAVLKMELDRWGIFEEYQDRFFRLFRRG